MSAPGSRGDGRSGVRHGRAPAAAEEHRPPRSSATIGLGTLLLLSAGALVLVLVEGDSAPVWMIVAWFLLAGALAVIVAALVPTGASDPAGRGPGEAAADTEADTAVVAGPDGPPPAAPAREAHDDGADAPGAER